MASWRTLQAIVSQTIRFHTSLCLQHSLHSMDGPSSRSAGTWTSYGNSSVHFRAKRSTVIHLGSGGMQFTSPSLPGRATGAALRQRSACIRPYTRTKPAVGVAVAVAHSKPEANASMRGSLAATTGMRRAEIAGLTWRNVDLDTARLTGALFLNYQLDKDRFWAMADLTGTSTRRTACKKNSARSLRS